MNEVKIKQFQINEADLSNSNLTEQSVATCKVAIFLCTFNGAEFLADQLNSIIRQTHTNWVIYASDDGSSDATIKILQNFQERLGAERFFIQEGPRQGFSNNFMSLVRNGAINADYYAFCDQDDLWFADKIERALCRLIAVPSTRPALYCSRTRLINELGQVIGMSPLFVRKPGFNNALVQSLAGANTILLNAAARNLIAKTSSDAHVVSHDWLAYLLVSGCGGVINYDFEPSVDYRQHGSNLMGSNSGFWERLDRIRLLFAGTFQEWNQNNLAVLNGYIDQLTSDSRKSFEYFEKARKSRLFRRLYFLWRAGVHRQSAIDNIALVIAGSIGKI